MLAKRLSLFFDTGLDTFFVVAKVQNYFFYAEKIRTALAWVTSATSLTDIDLSSAIFCTMLYM